MNPPIIRRTALVAILVVVAGACGKSSDSTKASTATTAAAAATSVTATEKEFAVGLSVASVPSGKVTITVRNAGKIPHELVAFKTDLDEAALPLLADGTKVDEAAAGIAHFDPEAEGVMPNHAKTITLKLTPGRYVMVCNLPGHYQPGMHAVLNVT